MKKKAPLVTLEPKTPAVGRKKALQSDWRILVVDDDQEVHAATDFALKNVEIFDRRLSLQYANSASEALALLEKERDFAVILLDVVMETEDAGLRMIDHIRNALEMKFVRIIIHTGQPGYAPEQSAFNDYDINDYRTKNELTQTRLIASLSGALRSYRELCAIARYRDGLELIVASSTEMMNEHESSNFASMALESLQKILKKPVDALICAQHDIEAQTGSTALSVIGAQGKFAHLSFRHLDDIEDIAIIGCINTCRRGRQHQFNAGTTCLFAGSRLSDAVIYLSTENTPNEQEQRLLKVFAANIAACLRSARLFEQLNFEAYHDSLTGLHNRSHFILDLNDVFSKNSDVVIALLDLEHFSDLNDGLGHEIGNDLLIAVASRLEEKLGNQCLLARLGSDIFGIIGTEEVVNPANLFHVFSEPFRVQEHRIPTSITLGLCRMSDDNTSGIMLLKRANIALNRAKHGLRAGHTYFIPEMEDDMRWRLKIVHRLREDFIRDALSVWYQPQIDLASGKLASIEALLRWPGNGDSFIQPPEVFIPLAEYSGLIIEIGLWVMNRACADFSSLRDLPGAPQRVAVNVSMAQFRQSSLAQDIACIMGEHGVSLGELEIEITESIAMHEPRIVLGTLLAIKTTGARIAIDDFGTGFSSLAHLRQLPIDALKIDKSFIAEIVDGSGGLFAETIITLGAKLGVATVAEGIETTEQAGFLRGLGCNYGQGYLYAAPMPLEELKVWMASRHGKR